MSFAAYLTCKIILSGWIKLRKKLVEEMWKNWLKKISFSFSHSVSVAHQTSLKVNPWLELRIAHLVIQIGFGANKYATLFTVQLFSIYFWKKETRIETINMASGNDDDIQDNLK